MKILKTITKKYYLIISLLLIFLVVYKIDSSALLNILKNANLVYIFIGMLMIIPHIFIKAWRWSYLNKIQAINYGLFDSFRMYAVALGVGFFTPGRVSEVIKVYYLKKDGHSVGKSLVGTIMDRVFDLAFLLLFTCLSGIIFFDMFTKIKHTWFIICIIILIGFIIVIKKDWHKLILKTIYYKLIPKKYQDNWSVGMNDFTQGLKSYSKKAYAVGFAITALAWLIYYLQIYFFAIAFDLNMIPVHYLMSAVTISGFVSLLPISVMGIGTRETILVVLLKQFTDSMEPLILLSGLILFDFVFGGIFGALMNLFKPLKYVKSKN